MAPLRSVESYSLVYIILNRQQIITHCLESEFMEHGGAGIKAAVQDQELRARLVWTLQGGEGRCFTSCPATAMLLLKAAKPLVPTEGAARGDP